MDERERKRFGLDALIRRGGARRGDSSERGFTLIETVVCVAIVVLLASFSFETLAAHPAQGRSTAVSFAALVADARSLAANSAAGEALSGSGASIGVVRDGDSYVATVYAYRPIAGAAHQPQAAENAAFLRSVTAIRLIAGGIRSDPPFAIFISASGHAAVQARFQIGVSPPLAAEPACVSSGGIVIALDDGTLDRAYPISCELAQLDLESGSSARPSHR